MTRDQDDVIFLFCSGKGKPAVCVLCLTLAQGNVRLRFGLAKLGQPLLPRM